MPKKIDPKVAEKVMLDAGLQPLEPYTNNKTKWKCRCLNCKRIVYPRLDSLQRGKGGCKFCAGIKRHLHFKMPDKVANEFAKKAKVIPLEPYVNQMTKWKCKCLLCGEIITPRLVDMKRHPNSMGCKKCANNIANAKLKLDEKDAIAVMRKGGLEPQEPYVKANVGWKSRCIICKRIVRPSLNSIRDGGGCRYCAIGGFRPQLPSYLYLVTNASLNAHKVGITNLDRRYDRLERLHIQGWQTYKKFDFKEGEQAKECEKKIFQIIRHDLKIPIYLSKEDMPLTGGHTETMDADLISLKELEEIINKVIKGLQEEPIAPIRKKSSK